MEFEKLITERYSVRRFKQEPVSQTDIDKILSAGHKAPTGCNYQTQRVLVINSPEAIKKLKNCTKCHFNAPMAMLVCHNQDEAWCRPYDNAPSSPIDAVIVSTHMMLQAHNVGVGCCWVMHFNPELIIKEFNLPQNVKPVALLVMGYPAEDSKPLSLHNETRPLNDVVKYNSF